MEEGGEQHRIGDQEKCASLGRARNLLGVAKSTSSSSQWANAFAERSVSRVATQQLCGAEERVQCVTNLLRHSELRRRDAVDKHSRSRYFPDHRVRGGFGLPVRLENVTRRLPHFGKQRFNNASLTASWMLYYCAPRAMHRMFAASGARQAGLGAIVDALVKADVIGCSKNSAPSSMCFHKCIDDGAEFFEQPIRRMRLALD
jgi:hypothetical protein